MGYYGWKKGKLLSFFKGKGLLLPEVVAEWTFINLFIWDPENTGILFRGKEK